MGWGGEERGGEVRGEGSGRREREREREREGGRKRLSGPFISSAAPTLLLLLLLLLPIAEP